MADISLKRKTLRTVASSREGIDLGGLRGDISLRDGLENIAQAIQNRLFTRKGELTKLGHPHYGSELYRLIGEPNSWKTKARAELYIREALKQEKRVEEIVDIFFPLGTTLEDQMTLAIVLTVKVYETDELLQMELNLNLG